MKTNKVNYLFAVLICDFSTVSRLIVKIDKEDFVTRHWLKCTIPKIVFTIISESKTMEYLFILYRETKKRTKLGVIRSLLIV